MAHVPQSLVRTEARPPSGGYRRGSAGVAGAARLVPVLVAYALGAPAFGQDFDARPVYYAMLQAAESGFAARAAVIESAHRASRAALERREASVRLRFDRERERIEREQRAWESAFEAERESLNLRIERLDQAKARLVVDPQVASLAAAYESAVEAALVPVNRARSRYRMLALEARARREALESAARAYRDGTSEDAQEIQRLVRAFQAFSAEQSRAIDERAVARRREVQEFEDWRQKETAHLRDLHRRRSEAVAAYAALADEHERRLRELNQRIQAYNERGRRGASGEGEQAGMSVLALDLGRRKEALEALHAQALTLARDIAGYGEAAHARREWFAGERAKRERALIREAEALRTGNEGARARIALRRREIQAQIEAVEARVSAGLRALEDELGEAVTRIESEFGPDPEALLTAATEWLGTGDHSLLYHAAGSERFPLVPFQAGVLYDAVDAAQRARRRLLDAGGDALAERRAALRREHVEIAERRGELLAARLASASRQARRWSRQEARRGAAQREIRHLGRALRSWFERHLALVESEFRPVQRALLDAAGVSPRASFERGERKARDTSPVPEEALLGDLLAVPPALSRTFLEDFAAVGRERDPRVPFVRWNDLHFGPHPETRPLEGEDERRLLAQWYRLLSERGIFEPIAHRLSRLSPTRSTTEVENVLYGLFDAGMREAGEIVEHQGEDGEPGYTVRILERRYRLDPDGRLRPAPPLLTRSRGPRSRVLASLRRLAPQCRAPTARPPPDARMSCIGNPGAQPPPSPGARPELLLTQGIGPGGVLFPSRSEGATSR